MSNFPTRVRLGWSDMKPAATFLLFAAGITLGVLLTTVCMVDLSTFSKQKTAAVQAPSSDSSNLNITVDPQLSNLTLPVNETMQDLAASSKD